MNALNNLGKIIGSLFAIGMGIFWAICANIVQGNGADTPTVWGIKALAAVAVISGMFGLFRAFTSGSKPAPRPALAGDAPSGDTGSDFDADAAFARYMARKAEETAQAQSVAPEPQMPSAPTASWEPESAPRPQFGRKGL